MTIKRTIQDACRRLGIYNRIRTSRLYDIYWTCAASAVLEERNNELSFYRSLMPDFKRGELIFDIGANEGAKTDIFLRMGAKVIAIDPDAFNQKTLRGRFRDLRVFPKPVTIVGKAVGDKNATSRMWVNGDGSALNTLSEKWVSTLRADEKRFGAKIDFGEERVVETVTMDSLIEAYGTPRFAKIDVEGYEPAVLRGLTQPIPLLSFEVNLPEFRDEGLECVEILAKLDRDGLFSYSADCREGLFTGGWMESSAFRQAFISCKEPSVEVFWRASTPSFSRRR